MLDVKAVGLLLAAKEELQKLQASKANRQRAIALLNLETSILWLMSNSVDEVLKVSFTKSPKG